MLGCYIYLLVSGEPIIFHVLVIKKNKVDVEKYRMCKSWAWFWKYDHIIFIAYWWFILKVFVRQVRFNFFGLERGKTLKRFSGLLQSIMKAENARCLHDFFVFPFFCGNVILNIHFYDKPRGNLIVVCSLIVAVDGNKI